MNDKEIPLFNKDRDRFYKRMSNEQHVMFDSILEVPFTFVEAKAGSGKTTVAFAAGIDMLANGVISKIIYIIKPSKRSYANGYLPGDLEQKTAQLYYAAYDALEVLQGIQKANGLVGIISHVEMLKDVIPVKLEILKGKNGSYISIIPDIMQPPIAPHFITSSI